MADSPRNNGAKTRKPVPPVEHQFKPGNPGRPKGSRNKLGEDFIQALAEDFAQHGMAAIKLVRAEKPDAYLKVIAQVVPKEVHHMVEDYANLSDDALEQLLIERLAAGNTSRHTEAGRGKGAQGKPATLPH